MLILLKNEYELLNILKEFTSISINILAILAGFNTASIAIIASSSDNLLSNSKMDSNLQHPQLSKLQRAYNAIKFTPPEKEINIVISFFSYAVISQLIILLATILLSLFISMILKTDISYISFIPYKIQIILLTTFIWVFSLFHCIFLSIRNIDMIAHFIKFERSSSK